MDYTPIGVGRVLSAFALTIVVAVLPVVAVLINSSATISAPDGYGGLVLGLGTVLLAMALIGLSRLTVAAKRRVVRRPSRA